MEFNKSLPNKISVNFRAFGQTFKLRLRKNKNLLSPAFTVREETNNKDISGEGLEVGSDCYYQGLSTTHDSSSAAISMCDGMVCSSLKSWPVMALTCVMPSLPMRG